MRLRMCFSDDKVKYLWSSFLANRNQISNSKSSDLISMTIYEQNFFEHFDPSKEFEKWAAVEVKSNELVPPGMAAYVIPFGLYAVFDYKGLANDPSIFQYIYSSWLPESPYELDTRPHFEILGSKYNNDSPDSEEEIWIPVKPKAKEQNHLNG